MLCECALYVMERMTEGGLTFFSAQRMAASELFNVYRFFSHIFQAYKDSISVSVFSHVISIPPANLLYPRRLVGFLQPNMHPDVIAPTNVCQFPLIVLHHQLQRILCLVSLYLHSIVCCTYHPFLILWMVIYYFLILT